MCRRPGLGPTRVRVSAEAALCGNRGLEVPGSWRPSVSVKGRRRRRVRLWPHTRPSASLKHEVVLRPGLHGAQDGSSCVAQGRPPSVEGRFGRSRAAETWGERAAVGAQEAPPSFPVVAPARPVHSRRLTHLSPEAAELVKRRRCRRARGPRAQAGVGSAAGSARITARL